MRIRDWKQVGIGVKGGQQSLYKREIGQVLVDSEVGRIG